MEKEIGGILSALGLVYFTFDVILWDGGLLDLSILTRINSLGIVLGF
jgi:hypothetical protein